MNRTLVLAAATSLALGACVTAPTPAADVASTAQLEYLASQQSGTHPTPAIRALERSLLDIAHTTSCELPLHVRADAGVVGGIAALGEVEGSCEASDVMVVRLDGRALHMRTLAEGESTDSLQCQRIYRYQPSVDRTASYNVTEPGPETFPVGEFCRNTTPLRG